MRAEYIIHNSLESRRAITQAKWHNQIFIMSIMSTERSFVNIKWINSYLVISSSQVQLSKISSTVEFIQHVVDCGDSKAVLDSDGIECSVISAKTLISIFFLQ